MMNQNPRTRAAGSSIMVMKKKMTSVRTRARGNITMYPPRTAEMAPEAPIRGTADEASVST